MLKMSQKETLFHERLKKIAEKQNLSAILLFATDAPTEQMMGLSLAVASCHTESRSAAEVLLERARLFFADNYSGLVLCQAYQAILEARF